MSAERVSDATCIEALALKGRVARRRLETYKRVERIDGELTSDQLADLVAVSERASARQRSVEWVIQHRDKAMKDAPVPCPPPPLSESASSNETPSAKRDDDVLSVELRALRDEGQRLRHDWEQLELHQKSEGMARGAWENRLRHAEEEMNALWDVVEIILEKIKLTASGQAKLERRIGYSQRRNERFQKSGRPPHAVKALAAIPQAEGADSNLPLETIDIQMSNGTTLEVEAQSPVGNQTEVNQRSLSE